MGQLASTRRAAALTFAFFCCVVPATASAQTWSAEQLSVWAVVEESWELDLAEDPGWVDRLAHPEMLAWGNGYPVPRNQADSRRWSEYGDENSNALIHSLSPVGIAVRGDAAVVHYYATVGSEDRDGERETSTSRCTDTLTRTGAAWLYLGWFCDEEPGDD